MNIHLSELLIIFIVALLVIKPEHLPEIALKMGRLVGWARQHLLKIKREMDLHE